MNDTEIQSMIVRLVGDGSSYQGMMAMAEASTRRAAEFIESATKQIDGFTGSIQGFAKQALGALSLFGVSTSLSSMFDKFVEGERSMIRLTSAIEANGQVAGPVIARYMEFAEALARTTLTSKGSALAMLKQAESMGLSGDAAMRAVNNAIGLGGATGQEAESYIRAAVAMEQGNVALLRRVPVLRGIRDETQLLDRAQQLIASGMRTATAEANSTGGRIEILKRSLAGFSREIGGMIATVVNPFVIGVQYLIDQFKALDPAVKKVTTVTIGLLAALTSLGPALSFLAPVIGTVKSAIALIGSGLGIAFSPIGILVGVVAAGIAAIVSIIKDTPGLWDRIKQAATDAWAWLQPVRESLGRLFGSILATATDAFLAMKTGILAIWNSLTIDLGIDWEKVRTAVVTVIDVISVVIRNFGSIARASFEQVRGTVEGLIETFQNVARYSIDWVYNTISANADLIRSIGGITFAIGGAVLAYRAVSFTIIMLNGLLASLGIYQMASSALWLAWSVVMSGASLVVGIFNIAFAVASALLSLSTIKLIAMVLAAGLWIVVMGVAKGVMWLYNAAILAFDALILGAGGSLSGATLAGAAWTVGSLIAKGATWLFNTALTALNALLGAIPLIIGAVIAAILAVAAAFTAAAATVAIFTAAFVLLQSAWAAIVAIGAGIWAVITDITDVLTGLPSSFGPVRALTAMFGEWWNILQQVARAARVDMPLAWEIIQAAARLALSQIRDLWQPLWAYVRNVSEAAWRVIVTSVELRMLEAADRLKTILIGIPTALGRAFSDTWETAKIGIQEFFGWIGRNTFFRATSPLLASVAQQSGISQQQADQQIAAIESQAQRQMNQSTLRLLALRQELRTAQAALDNSIRTEVTVAPSQATIDARDRVAELMARIPEAERRASDEQERHRRQMEELGRSYDRAGADISRFDAVLRNSGEAYRRIAAYRDLMSRPVNVQTNLMTPTVPRIDVPNHSWYSIYGMPVVDIATRLMTPTVPQVDVPNHSWYSIYNMPVVEIGTELVTPDLMDDVEELFEEPIDVPVTLQPGMLTGIAGMVQQAMAANVPSSVFTIGTTQTSQAAQRASERMSTLSEGELAAFGDFILWEEYVREMSQRTPPVINTGVLGSLIGSSDIEDQGGEQVGIISSGGSRFGPSDPRSIEPPTPQPTYVAPSAAIQSSAALSDAGIAIFKEIRDILKDIETRPPPDLSGSGL